jgi:hypothetical protein
MLADVFKLAGLGWQHGHAGLSAKMLLIQQQGV